MNQLIFLWSLVALLLAGCSTQTETVPTPLPTAIPPSAQDGYGDWAISFSHEFPEDAWGLGTHRYHFFVHCPIITDDVSTDWVYFEVLDEEEPSSETVFLRISGLSSGILTPININAIQMGQKTTAVITFLGVTEHIAEMAADNCEALVRWDDKSPQLLTIGETFIP
ncbi:MAG: hypothetical protein ISR58_06380 [Anaerolineales bacterium]|nr:hypothetical protein [Chloroflexota bacterium]MBL6980804.1 hypothetical protein [Anaerolineales bacterium]